MKNKIAALVGKLEKAKNHDAKRQIRKKIYRKGSEAAPYLIPFLKSKNDFIRWEIVSFLGEFQEPSTMKKLIAFALNEDEVHARWRSFWECSRPIR